MNGKKISITIDDLPFVSPGVTLEEIEEATFRIHSHLEKNKIQAVGFAVGEYVSWGTQDNRRLDILKSWQNQGHLLGSHTFSHISLGKVSLNVFIKDILKNESVLSPFWDTAPYKERFFRLPYLQWGSIEKFNGLKKFLSCLSYTLAPVTVNSFDFIFNTVYVHAQKHKKVAVMESIISAYISYIKQLIGHHERSILAKIGRPINHILLLHSNLINAHCLDKVAEILAESGYCFSSLREALDDPYYRDFNKWSKGDRLHFNQWWEKKGIHNEIEPLPTIDQEIIKAYTALTSF